MYTHTHLHIREIVYTHEICVHVVYIILCNIRTYIHTQIYVCIYIILRIFNLLIYVNLHFLILYTYY